MNYAAYKARLRAVTDADDDITWITMNGNHIPIKEGPSKEEAVKEWLAKKGGGNESKKSQPENKKDKDPEFETVRKNALANPNTYGGKYTQKSKAEAYKEYKDDTSSPESLRKANEFVNSEVVSKSNKPDYKALRSAFGNKYDELYNDSKKDDAANGLLDDFDKRMKNDPAFKSMVQGFVKERGDYLSSDREIKAFMLAAKEKGLLGESKAEAPKIEKPKREMSKHAQVASLIKKDLANRGFKVSASSSSYSGGDDVNVRVEGWYSDKIRGDIEKEFGKYQAGSVNPYEDYYEYNNVNNEIPQTKYLFFNFSGPNDDDYKTMEEYYRANWHKDDVAKFNDMAEWEKNRLFNQLFISGSYGAEERRSEIKKWAQANNKPFSYQDTLPEPKGAKTKATTPATKEQTIGELKSAGKDITKLQQAMQHIDYGFYEEKGKNMTPAQLVEHLEKEYANAAGKKDYYSTRVRARYPEAISLAKGYAESGTEKNDKQVFYKNVSGKQIYNKPGISTAKKGYTVVENELLTEAEMKKHGFDPNSSGFKKMELGKNEHRYQMGARFESGGAKESTKSTGGESSASKQPADIMEWKFDDVMKLKPSDSRVHKYIAKNNGLSTATVALLSEAFGSTEDLYNTIDQISDRKGYGWDKIKKDDD